MIVLDEQFSENVISTIHRSDEKAVLYVSFRGAVQRIDLEILKLETQSNSRFVAMTLQGLVLRNQAVSVPDNLTKSSRACEL